MMKTPEHGSVASFLAYHIENCGKKQYEIAEEIGFKKPNIITMIKQGITPLPRDKILKTATALFVDPLDLTRRVFLEYYPSEWAMLEAMQGQPVLVQEEIDLLTKIREKSRTTPQIARLISEAITA